MTLRHQGNGVWRFRVREFGHFPHAPLDPIIETFVVINGKKFSSVDVWDRVRNGLKIKRIGYPAPGYPAPGYPAPGYPAP